MAESVEVKGVCISLECPGQCEDCEKYFECNLPLKQVFEQRGILSMIRKNMEQVKHRIVVLGGKGGVGKTMLAVNLAAGLKKKEREVVILDQVYDCPAIPFTLGIPEGASLLMRKGKLVPCESKWGIKVVSTGLILPRDEVIIWYHQMKRNATEELLCSVDYDAADYLVVDIPTGTSSEIDTVLKYLPNLDGALVLTVPSAISQNVARKCIHICKKAKVPIIGVIENMGDVSCPHCGASLSIISKGAGKRMSEEEGVPFLGTMPFSLKVSESLDRGEPLVFGYPQSEEARFIEEITDIVIKYCEGVVKKASTT